MADSTNSTEWLIANFFRRALIQLLPLDPTQATIALVKSLDPNWKFPQYLVVPGDARPYGAGKGAQFGGQSLLLTQEFSIFLYIRLKTDQYSQTENLLVDPTQGTINLFKQLRTLFGNTYFGNGADFTLIENVWYERQGKTVLEDPALGLASREFVFSTSYVEEIPQVITINLDDVSNDR